MDARKILYSIVLGSFIIPNAMAATPGIFVGLGIGYSEIDTPNSNVFGVATALPGDTTLITDTENDVGGIGGMAYLGYNFNQYVGLELSYSLYSDSDYCSTQISYDGTTTNATANSDITYEADSYNIVAKGYLPFDNGIEIFGRAGAAIVNQKVKYDTSTTDSSFVIPVDNGDLVTPDVGTDNTTRILPTIGLGLGYNFNQNIGIDFAYNMVFGSGNIKSSTSAVPDLNMFTFDFTYSIG